MEVDEVNPDTVTAQITSVDKKFLREIVKNKETISKSEAVREGLKLLRREKGYSEKTGYKEVGLEHDARRDT